MCISSLRGFYSIPVEAVAASANTCAKICRDDSGVSSRPSFEKQTKKEKKKSSLARSCPQFFPPLPFFFPSLLRYPAVFHSSVHPRLKIRVETSLSTFHSPRCSEIALRTQRERCVAWGMWGKTCTSWMSLPLPQLYRHSEFSPCASCVQQQKCNSEIKSLKLCIRLL